MKEIIFDVTRVSELISESLKTYRLSRKNVGFDKFINEILSKDGLGKQRLEVYKQNNFLSAAYAFYKGKANENNVKDWLSCLIGYEFNAYLYKLLSISGSSVISLEVPVKSKRGRTNIDVIGKFDALTVLSNFSLIQPDLSEIVLEVVEGVYSFEAKALNKVSNNDVLKQLHIAVESKKYTKCFGVILGDASVSRDVVRSVNRIGAQLIRANSITKGKIIRNIMNIYFNV